MSLSPKTIATATLEESYKGKCLRELTEPDRCKKQPVQTIILMLKSFDGKTVIFSMD